MCLQFLATVMFLLSALCGRAQTAETSYVSTQNDLTMPPVSSFTADVVADNNSRLIIAISNPDNKKVQLTIKHSFTGVVVDTTIYDQQFSCRYNFENADDGKYIITIRNGKEKYKKEIALNTSTVISRSISVQ